MKRLLISSVFVMWNLLLFGQSQNQTPNFYIPPVTQPIPEAFSFTRYGDIPVGLFTGSMNYSIPLMRVESGKIVVPLSLEYTTNGVKVNDASGRTGVDWVLKSGGVITKTAVGRPDNLLIVAPPLGAGAHPNGSDSVDFYNWMVYVASTNANTQPDLYNYNFMGYSGKFYYDYAGNIKQTSPDGLKVTSYDGGRNFIIVTPDGTKYFFTQIDQNFNTSLYGDNQAINGESVGGTSWYLEKIKNVYNDSIVFRYTAFINPASMVQYISGISQSEEVEPVPNWFENGRLFTSGSNCGGWGGYYSFPLLEIDNCPDYPAGVSTDISLSNIVFAASLDEIIFKQGRIKFYYSLREDLPGEVKLDSLKILTKDSLPVKTIGLEYQYSQAGSTYDNAEFKIGAVTPLSSQYPYLKKRLFLKKVSFKDKLHAIIESYGFEYESINDLPPRLAYAQDAWGYFNGKMNSNLIPGNTIYNNYAPLNTTVSSRSVDSAFSKKGVLTKISYPTGGHTKITYESNQLSSFTIQDEDTVIHAINTSNYAALTTYSNTFTANNITKIVYHSEWDTPPDPNGPQPPDPMVTFTLENLTDPWQDMSFWSKYIPVGQSFLITTNMHLLNPNHVFRIKAVASEYNMIGTAAVYHWREVPDPNFNRVTAGLRVKEIRNYSYDSKLETMKRFAYNFPGLNYSSGQSIVAYDDARDFCYMQNTLCSDDRILKKFMITSSSTMGGYSNSYAALNYEYVTETFDSLGVGGAITTRFAIAQDVLPYTFACNHPRNIWDRSPWPIQGTSSTNSGFMNGKELGKTVFRKTANGLSKVKETKTYYSTDTRLYDVDTFFVVRRNFTRSGYMTGWRLWSDYDVNAYNRISAWVHVDSTVQTEFEDDQKRLVSKQQFLYANQSHLQPTEVLQYNSKGELIRNIIQYPDDLRALNPSNTILTNLVTNNIISVPLQAQTYNGSNLLNTVLIEYNASLFPANYKKSRSNFPMEVESEITEYDDLGNVRELRNKDQFTSFIVDTSTGQTIAGCVNARFSAIAYTSFETSSGGNWTVPNSNRVADGITGKKSYQVSSGSITKGGLSNTVQYIVTYWTTNSSAFTIAGTQGGAVEGRSVGNWRCFTHRISGVTSLTISGSGLIDELRLHPSQAQMTTYTYEPLTGISSQCDMGNKIIYYEYDAFGRLRLIRDHEKNILKTFDYQFQANNNQ